jgi:hypothetical protein
MNTMSEQMTKSDEERVAAFLFQLLDRPEHFDKEETRLYWTQQMRECMGEAQYDRVQFKRFLDWVLNMNAYSAEYMRKAKDPAATLKKNLPTLLSLYGAHLKGLEALERSKNKFKGKNKSLHYKQESGKRDILKEDV